MGETQPKSFNVIVIANDTGSSSAIGKHYMCVYVHSYEDLLAAFNSKVGTHMHVKHKLTGIPWVIYTGSYKQLLYTQ